MGTYDIRNEGIFHISKYLKTLAPIITDIHFLANAAYDLLTFVTSGETQSFVYRRRDSKLPLLNCGTSPTFYDKKPLL